MSWYRVEGSLPQHEKYAPLSDAAFRLAITAGCWCAENMTDGRLPKAMVSALTRAPSGKKLAACVSALLDAVIWEDLDADAYLVHDFLDWNMSKAQWLAKAAAGAAGGKAKAANRASRSLAGASDVQEQKHGTCSSGPLADSDSDSDSDLESESQARAKVTGISVGARRFAESFETEAPDRIEFTEEHREFAQHHTLDLMECWEHCRDYRRARKDRRESWPAEFMAWLRNEVKLRRTRADRAQAKHPKQPNGGEFGAAFLAAGKTP